MSDENQTNDQDAVQQLYDFVAGEMQSGSDKTTIARKLEDQGVDRGEAEQMVNAVYGEIAALVEKEQFSSSAIVPGLLGGVLGALLGGGVWAAIVIFADYELGIIAWGIGGACGFGVVTLAQGRKGVPLQIIAVATSVLGIVLGKYYSFFYFLREAAIQEYGEEAAADMSVLSPDVMQYFVQVLPEMASGYDALWVILAVITAWRIPKGSGIALQSSVPHGPIEPS